MESVLIVGLNCRPIALSAKKLGLRVHAVDFFGDVDLKSAADSVHSISGEYSSQKLVDTALELLPKLKPDGILLTSEVGCNPHYVKQLEENVRVLGNNSKQVSAVRDWNRFFKKLDSWRIQHPKTHVAYSEQDVKRACEDIGFPLVVKPTHGSAGTGVNLADNIREALQNFRLLDEALVQEYVRGVDASVSVMCSRSLVIPLSLNEQLLGLDEVGCGRRFQYCGNIVPLESDMIEECFDVAEKICGGCHLTGTVGIDLVLTENGPYVIEVNPRFQDTLECIERTAGVNLVGMHLDACEDKLVETRIKQTNFWCKGILYARKDCVVSGDLSEVDGCVDITKTGLRVRKDDPVCSILASAEKRDAAFNKMKNKITEIKKCLREK